MTGFQAFAGGRLRRHGITLRPATPSDAPLLAAIFASTRVEELACVPWSAERKKAFTDSQSALQEAHYANHYPAAERLLIDQGGVIGRVYVDTAPRDVRLMEISLYPEFRGQGIGTRVVETVVAYADSLGRKATLHVEPFNPAKRLYERFGFATVETRGIYELMERAASAS